MATDLPEGWSPRALGELGSSYVGLSGKSKADFGEGKPFITYRQVFNGGVVDLTDCELVTVADDERQHRVQAGDVLFTTSSETPEEVAYSSVVLGEVPELYLNSFCFGFRPNSPDELWPAFSVHLFKGPLFRREATRLGQGSTRFNISKTRLMEVSLPLPPLPEQKKIAAILSSVDEAIQKTQAVIEQTRTVKEGLLQELLTKGIGHTRFKQTEIGEIPEEWRSTTLKDVVDPARPVTYGIVQPGPRTPGGVPLIRGQNYIEGWEPVEGYYRVQSKLHRQYRRSITRPGDVLLCIVGATTGASARVPSWIPEANITQTTARLAPGSRIDGDFLLNYLRSPLGQSEVRRFVKGSAQPGLNLADVGRFRLVLPPLQEQKKIAAILSSVDEAVDVGGLHIVGLQEVKAGLLQDLLTGKVRVTP